MLLHAPRSKYNLSKDESMALKSLKNTRTITVKPCDKGGGIAILDTNLYMDKMENMLLCPVFYKSIPGYPEIKLKRSIKTTNLEALEAGVICKKELDFLTPVHTRIPIIYGLPKIHKDASNPPMRPIVSTIGSAIEPLSKYVDTFLKPMVALLPSCIRDTGHFISKIEGLQYRPDGEYLVTMDLESLYTNIPQQEAIDVVALYLNRRGDDPALSFILKCLETVLFNNYFDFNGKMYHQIKGVSMGAACAPSVANLYVGAFEDKFIYNEMAPFYENVQAWSRFIDDVFFIWKGSEDQLLEFYSWLNLCDTNLRFTIKYDHHLVEFLDVYIKHYQGPLLMTLYTKPTARNTLLHFDSFHPRNQKQSIPFS
ncbi:hypothetical protein NDU88_003763 [Pleurodeles waltl]|uniref:Reverse transcriptase domain-containing protein n=1 Tax=Pleurodeles waltl TaxID=8319 RepID=A0AAV7UG49_PLEWA|nr:hypothetical protein NDU88_003763 [Pleurodeles waltl]